MQNLTMDDWSKEDLSFVRGNCIFDDLKEPREIALNSLKYIYTDITDVRKRYISLGFHLSEFSRNNYYLDFGFGSMAEMAEANFGMDKGAVSRCIDVFRRFSQKQGCTHYMYLDDKFKNFSYSQLVEMLPLKDDVIQKITPDMSVRQIREFKKEIRRQEQKEDALFQFFSKVATSQPKNEEPEPKKLSDSYAPDDKVVIERFFDSIADFWDDAGFMPGELSNGTAKQRSFELSDGHVLTVRLSFSKSDSSS